VFDKEVEKLPIIPGTLIAEPHSWKSLAIGQPILRIRTTANRCVIHAEEIKTLISVWRIN